MNREDVLNLSIVIPSLNPDEKLTNTLAGVLKQGFKDIILVNDGSDENHMGPFEEAAKHPEVTILTHEINRGKGRALKTAMDYFLANRADKAGLITMDGDGQHHPEDVFNCGAALLERNELILGVRDFSQDDVPWKSRKGNNITKAVFRIFCGIKISDTQTGLRAFPTYMLPAMLTYEGERFEFETNMLLQMKKDGYKFSEVVIRTIYLENNASTHFHPFRDGWKIYKIILKFSLGTLVAFFLSSGLSFLIDLGLFTLLDFLLQKTELANMKVPAFLTEAALATAIAAVGARIVSSLFNYFVNRKIVFKSDKKGSIGRYYILAAGILLASTCLITLLATLFPATFGAPSALKTFVKGCIDVCLSLVSYKVQKNWVFRK